MMSLVLFLNLSLLTPLEEVCWWWPALHCHCQYFGFARGQADFILDSFVASLDMSGVSLSNDAVRRRRRGTSTTMLVGFLCCHCGDALALN